MFNNNQNKIKSIDEILNSNNTEFKLHDDVNIDEIPLLTKDLKFLLNKHSGFFSSSTVSFKSILIDTLNEFSILIKKIDNPFIYKTEYVHFINFGSSFKLKNNDLEFIFKEKWAHPEKWEKFHININSNYTIISFDTGLPINFNIRNLNHAFFALFAEFQYSDINHYNDDLKFLYEIYQVTSRLISKNALIPEFFKLNNGQYCIRWIPAFNSTVLNLIDNLAYRCPDNLLSYNGKAIGKYEQIISIISFFFNGFALYASYNSNSSLMRSMKSNLYFQLFFFKSQNFQISGDENKINNWLSPLFERDVDYYFILDVTQVNDSFLIIPKVCIDDESFILKDILSSDKYPYIVRDSKIITAIFDKYHWDIDLNHEIKIDINDFLFFNNIITSSFENNGIKVTIPEEVKVAKKAKLSLNGDKNLLSKTSLTLDDLNDFDWKVAIGDETFSLNEFKDLSQSYNGLVKINNKYLRIDAEDLDFITHQMNFIPINPTKNDYLFFVADKNGKVYYTKTNAEHTKKVQELKDNNLWIW